MNVRRWRIYELAGPFSDRADGRSVRMRSRACARMCASGTAVRESTRCKGLDVEFRAKTEGVFLALLSGSCGLMLFVEAPLI